jgi:tetratricopeptide (TPR) repeat protein
MLLLLSWAKIAAADDARPALPHHDLELLYHQGEYQKGLEITARKLASAPDKDLHWMKVRFMFEIGERFQRTDASVDKEAWYKEMLAAADAGLALAPGDPHLRFGRGIAMGRLGTTRGVLSSLFMAKDVEQDWLGVANAKGFFYQSIGNEELLPCDAYHALGIFYRLVPDWWIVQVIAGTRGDLDRSLDFHRKAVGCNPDDIDNWKELGATELCIADKNGDQAMLASGLTSLSRALALPARTERERIDHRHSNMLIAQPKLACEYSRDGQQDLDESKLPSQP